MFSPYKDSNLVTFPIIKPELWFFIKGKLICTCQICYAFPSQYFYPEEGPLLPQLPPVVSCVTTIFRGDQTGLIKKSYANSFETLAPTLNGMFYAFLKERNFVLHKVPPSFLPAYVLSKCYVQVRDSFF